MSETHWLKLKMLKRLLKERGIEIDGDIHDLGDLLVRMDMLLYAKQYVRSQEIWNSDKVPTASELKEIFKSLKRLEDSE